MKIRLEFEIESPWGVRQSSPPHTLTLSLSISATSRNIVVRLVLVLGSSTKSNQCCCLAFLHPGPLPHNTHSTGLFVSASGTRIELRSRPRHLFVDVPRSLRSDIRVRGASIVRTQVCLSPPSPIQNTPDPPRSPQIPLIPPITTSLRHPGLGRHHPLQRVFPSPSTSVVILPVDTASLRCCDY
jgi:hypothetical protein